MAQIIFDVCFDDSEVNSFLSPCSCCRCFLLFSFVLLICFFMWLKEELSRVNSIAVFSHIHECVLNTYRRTQTKFTKCVSKEYVNIYVYSVHSSRSSSFNFVECQDTLSTATNFFFLSHRQKRRWIVCFVKSWNSLNIVSHALRQQQTVFLSRIHYTVNILTTPSFDE